MEDLATAFSRLLADLIGPERLARVVELNRSETYPGVCHSHDFCDANEVMADAFRLVVGRDPSSESTSDAELWSAAWDMACAADFAL